MKDSPTLIVLGLWLHYGSCTAKYTTTLSPC